MKIKIIEFLRILKLFIVTNTDIINNNNNNDNNL